jgi:hypothetical protein
MLDLVPLAGAGQQVANRNGAFELVGQLGCVGAPRVTSSTKLSMSTTRVASSIAFFLRPPPSLRVRPAGADTLWRMSDNP